VGATTLTGEEFQETPWNVYYSFIGNKK